MDFVPYDQNKSGVPLGQFIPQEKLNPTFTETVVAAFAQENDITNALAYLTRPAFEPDPVFDILGALKDDPMAEQYPEQLGRAQSQAELNDIRARIKEEERNKAILAASGFSGFIASAAAGMVSPTSLVPLMGPSRGLKGAAEAFALAAAAIGTQEAALYGLQEARTMQEVGMGIAVGTVLGGLLGTTVRALTPAERVMVEGRMAPSPGETAILMATPEEALTEVKVVKQAVDETPDFISPEVKAVEAPVVKEPSAPFVQPELKRVRSSAEESLDYGGSYLRASLPNGGEVRFTKMPAGSGGAYFVGGEYVMEVRLPDGSTVSPKDLDPRSPNARLAGNTFIEKQAELLAAFKEGKLNKQVDDIMRAEGHAPVFEQPDPPKAESGSLSAAKVKGEVKGIKRAETYVGRQVDRSADWLASKGVPVLPKVIRTINDPIGMLARLNPVTRQLENPYLPSSRTWAAQLQTPGIKLEGQMPVEVDAVSRHNVHFAAQADFIRAYDDAWMEYAVPGTGNKQVRAVKAAQYKALGRAPAGKLTYTEFGDEVFRVAQTLEDAPEEIQRAADALNNYFDYVNNAVKKYSDYRKQVDGEDARSMYRELEFAEGDEIQAYVHHIFDNQVIEDNTVEFLRVFSEHGEKQLNAAFEKSYAKFDKKRLQLAFLKDIMSLDEAGLNKKFAELTARKEAAGLEWQAAQKAIKDRRTVMTKAGMDREEIRTAEREFEDALGPEFAQAMKEVKALDYQLKLVKQAGAGFSVKQIDLLEQLDELEELQLAELDRVLAAGRRLEGQMQRIDAKEARVKKEIARAHKLLKRYAGAYLRGQKQIDKLLAQDEVLGAIEAGKKAEGNFERLMSTFVRLEKSEAIDFEDLRLLRENQAGAVVERAKELNAKRVLREERLKERIKAADPEAAAAMRERTLAETAKFLDEFEEDFNNRWVSRGASGNPTKGQAEFKLRAQENAQELYKKIMGNPSRVVGIELLGAERGAELRRVLNLPLEQKSKFLMRSPEAVVRAHGHSMFPDMELYRMTGSVNGAPIFDELAEDYNRRLAQLALKPEGAARDAEIKKLNSVYKEAQRDWSGMIARFRHQRATPRNPDGFGYRLGRFAMNLNVTRYMGMVLPSSIPDMARVTFRYGMLGSFNNAWKPLLTDLPRVKAVRAEAQRAGIALDPLLHNRSAAIYDVFDQAATRQTMVERGMEFLANKTGFVALFDRWTAEMKFIASNAAFGEISHALLVVNGAGEFSAKELAKAEAMLNDLGIGLEMQQRMWKQYLLPGGSDEFADGFRLPNTESWTDFDAMMAQRAAASRIVNDLIITPGLDRPLWMDENLAFKMVAQFRSFTYTSTNRILMAGLQEPDMVFLQGAVFSVALGALSYYTWAVAAGGRSYEEAMKLDQDKWLYEAVARSGILGVLSEGQRIGEQIPGLNDFAVFGADESRTQRAGSLLGAVLGPSFDLAERLANVTQAVGRAALEEDGQITQSTLQQARTAMVPYQNVFYLRRLLDAVQESMAEAVGIPERRN